MKSFTRIAAANVSFATVGRHPAVLPFLAPAVYYSTSKKTFSDMVDGPSSESRDRKISTKLTSSLDKASRKVLQELRERLEDDVMHWKESQDEPGTVIDDDDDVNSTESIKYEPEKMVYFSEEEVSEAYSRMRSLMARQGGEDMALAALTQSSRRLPKYLYAVIPDALRAVERHILAIENEVEMIRHSRDKLEKQRRTVRHLLDGGRSVGAITAQYKADLYPGVDAATKCFAQCMTYLIQYRRLYRLAATIMEAIAVSERGPSPQSIGKVYHMLILERLAPFRHDRGILKTEKKVTWIVENLSNMLLRIFALKHRWPIRLPQAAIYLLADTAPVPMLKTIYWKLQGRRVRMKPFTVFHFVRRLAQPDEEAGTSKWEDAFEILYTMQYRGSNLATEQAKFAFYGVLYQAMRANDQSATEEIINLMMNCGLKPGVPVYNMLMARAAEANDVVSLQKYFKAIIDSGHQPSMVSHSISHAFYKRTRNERERQNTLRDALDLDINLGLFLATDILHAAVLEGRHYEYVYQRFRSFFNTKVLETFGIALAARDSSVFLDTDSPKKINPDHVTFAVMLTSYCMSERSVAKVWDLYKLYQKKLTDKSAPNASLRKMLLTSGSYTPHAIMLGLGKRMEGLPYIAAVLEDMLKPNSAVESNVYTWSIFLHFLTRAGKMDESETVMEVMRSRGLEPNTVTYTTLLSGYVKMGRAEHAEEVLDKMSGAGVDTNVYTWTSLLHGYVKDGNNWRAGDVFRRMLDSSVQPDEVTLQAVSGVTDRAQFEVGLGGEEVAPDGSRIVPGA